MRVKKLIKNLISWLSASLCAFIVINLICVAYSYDPAGCVRPGGAFSTAYQPGRTIINNQEGYGIAHVDANGYLNESADLSDDGYVLIMGNSMTNAVQVNYNEKYSAVLNERLREHYADDKVHAYMLARPGSDFAEIAGGLTAALQEFPKADAVVIQIVGGMLYYSSPSLDEAYSQRRYDDSQKPDVLISQDGIKGKIKRLIKNYIPVITFLFHERSSQVGNPFEGAFIFRNDASDNLGTPLEEAESNKEDDERDGQPIELSEEEYYAGLEDRFGENANAASLLAVMEYLNELTDAKIIILDLASEDINPDGSLKVSTANTDMWKYVCHKVGAVFVDTTDVFKDLYEDNYTLGYGFSNTTPGYGHMNAAGHNAVADKLYDVLINNGVIR